MRKIPPDAFEFYLSLGVERSYRAVAEKFGVSKQAVTKCAAREKWQHRLDEIEVKARAQSEKKATDTMAAVRERHLAASRVILGKGLEALRNMSLETAMEAVKAIDLAMKQERLILGEPSERTAVSIEEVIKREYERWMGQDEEDSGNGRGNQDQQARALP